MMHRLGVFGLISVFIGAFSTTGSALDLSIENTVEFDSPSEITSPQISAHVCERSLADFQKIARDESSRLSVGNRGGLFNGGVCWWHSRLQRSAIYLTEFRPDLPKPNHAQGVAIINTLARMSNVVVIPGYRDFYEFSSDFEREIISRLEKWQVSDGVWHFRWVDGLKGHAESNASSLQYIMGRIHDMVAVQHRIVFEKVVMKGITTHALLIVDSKKKSNGYTLKVIDSNAPNSTSDLEYRIGDTHLIVPSGGEKFVPYLDFEGDMGKIFGALNYSCHRAITQ